MPHHGAGLYRALPALVIAGVLGISASWTRIAEGVPVLDSIAGKQCWIKGNISQNNGQKIYHVQGQEHYEETRIREEHGERWFCSEKEARAAGWRKAKA